MRLALLAILLAACSGDDVKTLQPDGALDGALDAAPDVADAMPDAARPQCQYGGAPGRCLTAASCSLMSGYSPFPSPSCGTSCCVVTPDARNNPPIPAGWKLLSPVTAEESAWAVMIFRDPVTYPMFAVSYMTFGTQLVMARVEWHHADSINPTEPHRGVTLYVQ
jgi:hypothetical protein